MKDIPDQTRSLLSDICRNMPKTPYRGAKAISDYLYSNYKYGSDENITQKKWERYPHEIINTLNCNDTGIFSFLLTKQLGLDSSIIRLENFRGNGQDHIETIIRGSQKDYIMSQYYTDEIKLFKNHYLTSDGEKNKFDKIIYQDIPELMHRIKESNKKLTIKDFLSDGKTLSSYFGKENTLSPINFYSIHTSIQDTNEGMLIRNSYVLPGFYLHHEILPDKQIVKISSGIDNMKLISPYTIITCDNITKKINYHIDELSNTKKTNIYRVMMRSLKSNMFSNEQILREGYKYKEKRREMISESQKKINIGLILANNIMADKSAKKAFQRTKIICPYKPENLHMFVEYHLQILKNNDKISSRGNQVRKIVNQAKRMLDYQNRKT